MSYLQTLNEDRKNEGYDFSIMHPHTVVNLYEIYRYDKETGKVIRIGSEVE